MCNKTKNKNKKTFTNIVYSVLEVKKRCKNIKEFV